MRQNWLASTVIWLVLGVISLCAAGVTSFSILEWHGIEKRNPALLTDDLSDNLHEEPARYAESAGAVLVASMTTWALAWFLVLNAFVPDGSFGQTPWETARRLGLLVTMAAFWGGLFVIMVAVLGAGMGISAAGVHALSWLWKRVTGRDIKSGIVGGYLALVLLWILMIAAVYGLLLLLSAVILQGVSALGSL